MKTCQQSSLLVPALVLTGAIALVLAGCSGREEPKPAAQPPPAAVRVQAVQNKTRVATEEVVGTVRAKLQAVIEGKVSGKIGQLPVVPGQSVKRGDLLATIEAREVQARLDQAIAVRQQAEGDLKRFATLLEQKVLPQSEYDTAQARFRVADAGVREAETLLGYTAVTAPFDGVVTRKYADVGDLAAPGKPLLSMEDPRSLRLEADVPEAVVGHLKLGDRLAVRIAAAGTGGDLEGVVSEIAPAADENSRTFLVKCDLPGAAGLRAGQFGRVAIPVGTTDSVRVQVGAVFRRGQMETVFVVTEGRARLRLVKTGRRTGDEVELVSGVSAGEQVVVAGAPGLVDGQPVRIEP